MATHQTIARQSGIFLIEALICILLLAIGIIGLVSMQSVSIQQVSQAKYRIDAASFAEQLIGEMWAADHTTTSLQGLFASPNGTRYATWKNQIASSKLLPGVTGTALSPQVSIVASASDPQRSRVTIVILWQAPGDSVAHSYSTVTEIR